MTYNFEIGPEVEKKKTPKLKWRLHVRAMSGDADHYEHKTSTFNSVAELEKYFSLVDAFCRLSWNAGCDDKAVRYAVKVAAKLVNLNSDEAWDWYTDFIGYDVTSDGHLASPDNVWVTYFDEHGLEHDVTINGVKNAGREHPVVLV